MIVEEKISSTEAWKPQSIITVKYYQVVIFKKQKNNIQKQLAYI